MMKSPFFKDTYTKNAQIYKILANPIRLEILNLLKERPYSLEELTEIIGVRKPNVSQHLTLLKYSKLISTRKVGQEAYYQIVNKKIIEPCKVLHEMRQNGLI